jgi:hypothetical protein
MLGIAMIIVSQMVEIRHALAIDTPPSLPIVGGVIVGGVNSDGTPQNPYWTVQHPNTGYYTINFTRVITDMRLCIVMPLGDVPVRVLTAGNNGAPDSCQISLADQSGHAIDAPFQFISAPTPPKP